MGFLNPWVLAGLAAVSIPVAIHLLNKLRVQRTRWAAMRFVQESLRRNQRRLKIEDLILLVLRCLVVALLVLAFARPVLRALVPGMFGGDGPASTVVVLDNSASMAQSNGVSSRFDEGRSAIRQVIDRAPAGSQFGFYLVSNRADPLMAKPAADLPRFRRSLELAATSDRSTDLAAGVRAAFAALEAQAGRKEVVVFTDSQAPAWTGLEEIRKIQKAQPDVLLQPRILGQAGEDNLAVVLVAAEGGVPAAGQPCRFRVDVANFGTRAAEAVRVTLSADNQAPSDETLIPRIEPGASSSVNLFVRFDGPGFHSVTARIPPDRLAIDNERSAAVEVVNRMEVLVVEGGRAAEQDGFFLANALAPVSTDRKAGHFLSIRSAPFEALGRVTLSAFDTVFLSNPGALTEPVAATLQKYVADGGNLVVFPGPKTDPASWNKPFLPAALGPRRTAVKPPVGLASQDFTHPITAIWNDRAEGGLGAVRYSEFFPLLPRTEGGRVGTILRLADGQPAAIEWSSGRGKVVLFNAPATPAGNNLVLHPGFVALMQRMMGFLNRGVTGKIELGPGETFELPVAMELLGRDFSVVRPGEDQTRRAAGRVELADQEAIIRYRDTDQVGVYQVFIGSEDHPAAVFVVQMDPVESDLRQAPRTDIEALEQRPAASGETTAPPRLEVKKEYWAVLIWLAALLALAEAALAHRMSVSR